MGRLSELKAPPPWRSKRRKKKWSQGRRLFLDYSVLPRAKSSPAEVGTAERMPAT